MNLTELKKKPLPALLDLSQSMGLDGLGKTEKALKELADKGMG